MCCLYIYIDLYKEQLLVQTTMADILSGDTLSHQIYSFQLSLEQDIGLKDQLPLNIMTMSRLNPFIYNSYFFQTYRICDLIIFNCLLLFDALMPLFYNKKTNTPSTQSSYRIFPFILTCELDRFTRKIAFCSVSRLPLLFGNLRMFCRIPRVFGGHCG